jgi:N-acetylglutamate synthase-like GNAT family acetyltransferase
MDGLIYKTSLPGQQVFYELFTTTNWNDKYQLNALQLFQALKNSWFLVSAYENENLVGFGRIICDGVVHALILDLIVHPDFQDKGIGGAVLEKLVAKCKEHNIHDIQLFCAKGYTGFYEKRGFRKRPDDAPGMEIKMNQ